MKCTHPLLYFLLREGKQERMGYNTDICGCFNLNKPLTRELGRYLRGFSQSRRVKRDPFHLQGEPDPLREAIGLPLGIDGEYYVGDGTRFVVDYNKPPSTQPGLWCQWIPSKDLTSIHWDGNEKFYNYDLWLQYIIKNFLDPFGYVLNGEVEYLGEDVEDFGVLRVENNILYKGRYFDFEKFSLKSLQKMAVRLDHKLTVCDSEKVEPVFLEDK